MNTEAKKAREADARLAFDNHSHAARRHLDASRKLLEESQLSEHPDSVIIPVEEIYERWVQPALPVPRARTLAALAQVHMVDLSCGVYFEVQSRLGLQPVRGFRYGPDHREYWLGFGGPLE